MAPRQFKPYRLTRIGRRMTRRYRPPWDIQRQFTAQCLYNVSTIDAHVPILFNAVRSSSVILSSHFRTGLANRCRYRRLVTKCQLHRLLICVSDCDMCRLIVTGEGQLADHLLHGIDFFGDYLVPALRGNRLQELQVPADSQRLGVKRFHLFVEQAFGPRSAVECSSAERQKPAQRTNAPPKSVP